MGFAKTHFLSFLLLLVSVLSWTVVKGQPANNPYSGRKDILLGPDNYQFGTFYSDTVTITNATAQAGEHLLNPVYNKTVWYRFTIPTSRKIRVRVLQSPEIMQSNDAGFLIYQETAGLPTASDLATFTPLFSLSSYSENICLEQGSYAIQVVARSSAAGNVFVELLSAPPESEPYDQSHTPIQMGVLKDSSGATVKWNCLSIENVDELCPALGANYMNFTRSAWLSFSTDEHIDLFYFRLGQVQFPYGIRIFEGNVETAGISGIQLIYGCEKHQKNDEVFIPCELFKPNTTYSIQLLGDYRENVISRLLLRELGEGKTQAAIPQDAGFSAQNQFGLISPPPGGSSNISRSDYFSCEAQLSNDSIQCGTVNPANTVQIGANSFALCTWFTFELNQPSNVTFNLNLRSASCNTNNHGMGIRIYTQTSGNECTALNHPSDLYAASTTGGSGNYSLTCLPAGKYSIQVLGKYNVNNPFDCNASHFGRSITLSLLVTPAGNNDFALTRSGDADPINADAALQNNVLYNSTASAFACVKSVLPLEFNCNPNVNRAKYREFILSDSGMVTIGNVILDKPALNQQARSVLYRGSARDLALAQNTWNWPDRFNGLSPLSNCAVYTQNTDTLGAMQYCLEPGKYTLVTFGDSTESGLLTQPTFRWAKRETRFWNPAQAEDLGDVIAQGLSRSSQTDTFSCRSNPATIAGLPPCSNANKLIYREFYLSEEARVTVSETFYQNSTFRIFQGRASGGIAGLSLAQDAGSTCFNGGFSTPTCSLMPAGWYTVVSYGSGIEYHDSGNPYNPGAAMYKPTKITVSIDTTVTKGPLYNRPFKACVGNNDLPIELVNAGTASISARGRLDTLCREYFRQTVDTPFTAHPIMACPNSMRTAYYVFRIGSEMNIRITGTAGFKRELYPLDVRTDSMLFPSTSPVIPCDSTLNTLVICRLQPGAYTLVVYASKDQNCHTVKPSIIADTVGLSRFDHASKAYDFGLIEPTNTYQGGKTGEVHPSDPGLLPSNDFFFCTTGSQSGDPAISCSGTTYPPVYPDRPNNFLQINGPIRRNLWYSFVIQGKGDVSVWLRNLTAQYDGSRAAIPPFAVYRSDADGEPDLQTLLSTGELDSTLSSGLTFIGNNLLIFPPCTTVPKVEFSFKTDQCVPDTIKRRYYVLVDLNEGQTLPVTQIDVQVKFKPLRITSTGAAYDFYSFANQVGHGESAPPYTTSPVLPDSVLTGEWSDLSCATNDTSDKHYNLSCLTEKKTVWYKIRIGQRGVLRYRLEGSDSLPGAQIHAALFRQIVPGDSTLGVHLKELPLGFASVVDSALWQNYCLGADEYYLLISTCNPNDTSVVRPLFCFEPDAGFTPYDHVSTANQTGFGQVAPPYNTAAIPANSEINGAWGDLTCATNDESDRNYSLGCTDTKKTLWYKVKIGSRGLFRYRIDRAGLANTTLYSQLFRQTLPGDTILGAGMQSIPVAFTSNTSSGSWSNFCLDAGEYYIFISTCSTQDTSTVRPVVFFDNQPGIVPYDYYSTGNEVGSGLQSPPYPQNPVPLNTEVSGAWGDLTCATTDISDMNYNTGCTGYKKTLWYRFFTAEQSIVRIRLEKSGGGTTAAGFKLFSQDVPGDSVLNTGFTEIPYLSTVSQGGFTWYSFCIPAGAYFIHVSTCNPGETSIVRPVLVSETSTGDNCQYAVSTLASGAGVFNAQSVIYCNTIGGSFGEDGSNMGCLPGPSGYYSTWFRFEYTGSDVVDVLFQLDLSNLSNYGNSGNIRYRLFYGPNCNAMIVGQECASNAFINNSISCINSSMGAFYIQVVYPVGAVGTLGFKYTVSINNDINCSPFNPFLIYADFLYRPNCAGDSIYFSNYSTAGADLIYLWDFDFPGGQSTELNPAVKFPSGAGSYNVQLRVVNPVNQDTVLAEKNIQISADGNPVSLGPDQVTCIGDTLELGSELLGATYLWSNGETGSGIRVWEDGDYSLEVDLAGCIFKDTVNLRFVPFELVMVSDTFLCPGMTVQVLPYLSPEANHQWLDANERLNRVFADTGLYFLQAEIGNCRLRDSVHISELSYSFNLGNDTAVCLAAGYVIHAGQENVSGFQWSDGSTADSLRIDSPGSYILRIDSLGCYYRDTIQIDSLNIGFHLGRDTTICLGDSLLLSPSVLPGVQFHWSTSDTLPEILVRDSSLYWLEITFEACSARDSISITTLDKPLTSIVLPPENPCIGDCFNLDAILVRSTDWTWVLDSLPFPGNLNPVEICFPEFRDYPVQLMASNRCGSDTSAQILEVRFDSTLHASADTTVFAGDTAWVYLDGGTSIHWSSPVPLQCDTCLRTQGVFIEPSELLVNANDRYGCPVQDTVLIHIYREFGLFVPNSFTPNQDGKNDRFEVYHYGVEHLELEIFNRFGESIFQGKDLNAFWDGTYMGKVVENDVYTYAIQYYSYDGRAGMQRGRVLVLR